MTPSKNNFQYKMFNLETLLQGPRRRLSPAKQTRDLSEWGRSIGHGSGKYNLPIPIPCFVIQVLTSIAVVRLQYWWFKKNGDFYLLFFKYAYKHFTFALAICGFVIISLDNSHLLRNTFFSSYISWNCHAWWSCSLLNNQMQLAKHGCLWTRYSSYSIIT